MWRHDRQECLSSYSIMVLQSHKLEGEQLPAESNWELTKTLLTARIRGADKSQWLR